MADVAPGVGEEVLLLERVDLLVDVEVAVDAVRLDRRPNRRGIAAVAVGAAIKLLSTVILATAVAFVSFMVKPSDLDARFGMGVGALFAVAASAFIVSSSVPDSASLTVADRLHVVALGGIFLTLLISAFCLRMGVSGREVLAFRIDHWCLAVLPILFFGWVFWAIVTAAR